MASAAESVASVASVARPEIAALQQRLLQPMHSSPLAPRPPPSSAKSASAAEAEAAAANPPSSSQEAFRTLTRAQSFCAYPGGDTQPMDTQVYRDYAAAAAATAAAVSVGASSASPPPPFRKTVLHVERSPERGSHADDVAAMMTHHTPATLAEGDSGYVDLANAWQPASPTVHSTSDIEDLLASAQTQRPYPPDAGMRQSMMAETPTMAGHRRRRAAEIPTSATSTTGRTPGFSQLFGGGGGIDTGDGDGARPPMLTATQLFGQTQAPSSPVADEPRSDPLTSRPSPDMPHHGPLHFFASSSPVAAARGRSPSSPTGEPGDDHRSTGDMRERRLQRARRESRMPMLEEDEDKNGDGDDDDDADSGGKGPQRRSSRERLHDTTSDETPGGWAKARPASRHGSRLRSSRTQPPAIDLVTPAPARKGVRVEFTISDDDADTDSGDMPMNEDDLDDGGRGVASEDDMYYELGQTVLRSQRDAPDDGSDDVPLAAGRTDDEGEEEEGFEDNFGPETTAVASDEAAGSDGDVAEPPHQPSEHNPAEAATQYSAIADSQPGRAEKSSGGTTNLLVQQSSLPAVVPASQYAARASQDRVHMRASHPRQPSDSQLQETDKVPSSPPLPNERSMLPEDWAEDMVGRRELLSQLQSRPDTEQSDRRAEHEIPDTDNFTSDATRPATADSAVLAWHKGETRTLLAPFPTTQNHLSAPGLSSPKQSAHNVASQRSGCSADSPRRAAGVRRFADIAADPSPPHESGESQVDIDAIMGGVITAEDHKFIEAMSNPPAERAAKRRKLMYPRQPDVVSRSASPTRPVLDALSREDHAYTTRLDTAPSAPLDLRDDRLPAILQSSPSKANELPLSREENAEPPQSTQDSVKRREEAGAQMASQLVSQRPSKRTSNTKPRPSKLVHKGRMTPDAPAEEDRPKSAPPLKLKLKASSGISNNVGHAHGGKPEKRGRGTEQHNRTPKQHRPGTADDSPANLDVAVDRSHAGDGSVPPAAQDRVFALFKGHYNNFYPATWLSSSVDGRTHKVRFDDTTVTDVDAHHVRAFDVRVGDHVKVDGPGMRKGTWIIKGFGKVAEDEEERAWGTDTSGHVLIKVQAKVSRVSLPTTDAPVPSEGDVKEVLATNIYLKHTMWPGFADRTFTPPVLVDAAERDVGCSRLATPSTGLETPDTETPGSRPRRALAPTAKAREARNRISHLREESIAPATTRTGPGLFARMAFALSYGREEAEKADVTRLIQSNGGIILESGFDELFELPSLDDVATGSLAKPLPKEHSVAANGHVPLRLRPEYEDLGFVALIADRHSRRAKYMQALALGLPTLSSRWITDCLRAPGPDSSSLPWSKYLLSAGESVYLQGAVRSRTLPAYEPVEARLADTMANRELMLNGDGVLIVASKKNKATWERRKAYAFLTLALGAGRVKRVNDLQEAKAIMDGDDGDDRQWKWIYVEGSVAEASRVLFGRDQSGARSRKRERREEVTAKAVDAQSMSASDGRVKLVNDEFVVQSLILGALVE